MKLNGKSSKFSRNSKIGGSQSRKISISALVKKTVSIQKKTNEVLSVLIKGLNVLSHDSNKTKANGEALDGLQKECLAKRQKFLLSLKAMKRLPPSPNHLWLLQNQRWLLPNRLTLLLKWIFLLKQTLLLTQIHLNLWTFRLKQKLRLKKVLQKRVLLIPRTRKKKKARPEVV